MRSETGSAPDMTTRMVWFLAVGLVLFTAPPLAAQSETMNFFVAVEGAGWGATRPATEVSDSQCTDIAYPEGFGHLNWRSYLTNDGDEANAARQRIGTGPWFNFYGVEIAANLDQLHSDANNLSLETAVTVKGQARPALEIPAGSELDGGDYSRQGPFFCFGVP